MSAAPRFICCPSYRAASPAKPISSTPATTSSRCRAPTTSRARGEIRDGANRFVIARRASDEAILASAAALPHRASLLLWFEIRKRLDVRLRREEPSGSDDVSLFRPYPAGRPAILVGLAPHGPAGDAGARRAVDPERAGPRPC